MAQITMIEAGGLDIPVFGLPLSNAVEQMQNVAQDAKRAALMADHHLGYSQPIGGVVGYADQVSPSGVGYDIACGNKAVRTDMTLNDFSRSHTAKHTLYQLADDIAKTISFGVGQINDDDSRLDYFDALLGDSAWNIPVVAENQERARDQLGTVGSGNHYVDIFADNEGYLWIGVHFGSRGLGHKIATHYVREGGGQDGINAPAVLLDPREELGREYLAAMNLAGRYAYAGRDWVCQRVADLMGAHITDEVHNHHNFAWLENHEGQPLWVIRKGATPAYPGEAGFVGGSMGDNSVILQGVDSPESASALYSTVHGAGRAMSRRQAAGKFKGWGAKRRQVSPGAISLDMMNDWVDGLGVIRRGGGVDESPHVYKRLPEVLAAHEGTIEILYNLQPLIVVMAGADEVDPFKD